MQCARRICHEKTFAHSARPCAAALGLRSAARTGAIPGATEAECGNYREQDLEGARAAARKMLPILKDWTVEKLAY